MISQNGNGMQSSCFGPIWFSLHCVSFGYPVKPTPPDQDHYKRWLLSWGDVLPCKQCRQNFKKNLEDLSFDSAVHLKSRDSFVQFIWTLHNHVNLKLGKDQHPLKEFDDVVQFYEQLRATDCNAISHAGSTERSCVKKTGSKQPVCTISILPQDAAPSEHLSLHSQCCSDLEPHEHMRAGG